MGDIVLIGVDHINRNAQPNSGNYEGVKKILEECKHSFISQELRLYFHLTREFARLLRASARELDIIESELRAEDHYLAEFAAGIIYAKRNKIPVYWTDLYYGSLDEVVNTNVLEANPMDKLWADDRDIPEELMDTNTTSGKEKWRDNDERNKFTAPCLAEMIKKHSPGEGVHVGGRGHHKGKIPLQKILANYIPRNTIKLRYV